MEAWGEKYIRSLIAQGEHQQLDFKFEITDAKKIARTLSAFSNTHGGRLLVGVKDNGRITGIRSDEEYYMIESAASLYCKPEVQFSSRIHSVVGKNILEIYIPLSENKPVYARDDKNRWMAYIRVADQSMLAGIVQLRIWTLEREKGEIIQVTDCWSSPGKSKSCFLPSDGPPVRPFQSSGRIQDSTGKNWWT